MNPLAAAQAEGNAESRERWDLFGGHREHVTELLCDAGRGRLCVLGAGNCNDLDLPKLLASFREVHLVDPDAAALEQGVARQGVAGQPALRLHGGIDVSGMFDVMGGWSAVTPVQDTDLLACVRRPAERVAPALPGPFDVVASVCLLSQLLSAIGSTITREHARYPELLFAVRGGHLNLLLHLLRPGGTGFLVTDVVSSETLPDLAGADLTALAATGNFFDGLNPVVLESLFRTAPALAGGLVEVTTFPAWRWEFGPRAYLVWAVRFRKT